MTQIVYVVLGMHRSGTSCLTGSLQQAGLYLGEVHTQNPYNKKGNRENPQVMDLHEGLLSANGGSWYAPPEMVKWSLEDCQARDAVIEGYREFKCWGFKDPRTLFTLDGWLSKIPNMKFIGTIRHPLAVAESLQRRNALLGGVEFFMDLWDQYNRRLIEVWEENHFPIIDFDKPDGAYRESLSTLMRRIGLRNSLGGYLLKGDLKNAYRLLQHGSSSVFFDPELRSAIYTSTDDLPPHIKETYLHLKDISL